MGLAALVIAAIADLIAGIFLTTMEDYLLTITGMMILIYCAIGMRGNIFGSMGSRLGTSMHMGTFKMTFKKNSVLRSNVEAALALTLSLSIIMGVVGWVVTVVFFGPTIDPFRFVFISLVGGILAGAIVVIFNIIIAYVGFKRDWDVDNITAPLIAAAGDIATVPMIFVATLMQEAIADDWIIYAVCIILTVVSIYVMVSILLRKNRRRKRMNEAKRILRQSTPVLLVCMLFEILAGVVIQNETDSLVQYAVILVLLPAFLNEGNALSGMLTSRLSSMLHLGTLDPTPLPQKGAYENFMLIYILAAVTFIMIGSAAFGVQPDSLAYVTVIAIVLIAGMLTTTVINILSYYVAIAATKFNLDPDDHCIPITSSVMDVVGTVILVTVIGIILV
ncbi:MAG: magnesium transporter [Candidatus Methanomethylophilaceae archaeon]|nr:magnesium transporter [Candidatus Methanomethylophilaceae archaeon]